MRREELMAVAERKPFKPFQIRLADGEMLPVSHSEFLAHSPNWRTVIVWDEKGRCKIVDTALVTAIETESEE